MGNLKIEFRHLYNLETEVLLKIMGQFETCPQIGRKWGGGAEICSYCISYQKTIIDGSRIKYKCTVLKLLEKKRRHCN